MSKPQNIKMPIETMLATLPKTGNWTLQKTDNPDPYARYSFTFMEPHKGRMVAISEYGASAKLAIAKVLVKIRGELMEREMPAPPESTANPHTVIATVFQPGRDFTRHHVELLRQQIPGLFVFGIDRKIPVEWHGWWAKMALFDPSFDHDILFFDLDTLIVGDLSPYTNLKETHMIEDFYYPDRMNTGVMFIKQCDKKQIWEDWKAEHKFVMKEFNSDAQYISLFFKDAPRMQHKFKGRMLSYKRHLKRMDNNYIGGGNVADADIICFHGQPRPWDVEDNWVIAHYQNGNK